MSQHQDTRAPIRLLRRAIQKSAARLTHALGGSPDVLSLERKHVTRRVLDRHGLVVTKGPLAGTRLPPVASWGESDVAGKVLGLYEEEIVRLVKQLSRKERTTLIDLGAADGFYAVGCLATGMFERCIAFEATAEGRRVLMENASLNGVADRLTVQGRADRNTFASLRDSGQDFEDCVIMCDIEGAEFEVLHGGALEIVSRSELVIELHDWSLDKSACRSLSELASEYFNVAMIKTGSRDLSGFPTLDALPDNERWLLASEGRREAGLWMHLSPRDRESGNASF